MKIFIISTLLLFTSISIYSQSKFIDQDDRIKLNIDTIVSYLRENTIGDRIIHGKHLIDTSANIYIVKRMEIYHNCDGVLLVKFGLLSSKPFEYWAIITNKPNSFYILPDDLKTIPSEIVCDSLISDTILEYYNYYKLNYGCIYC